MTKKTSYKPFIILGMVILIAVIIIVLINKANKKYEELQDKEAEIEKLKQNITILQQQIKANQTIVKEKEITKVTGWTIFFAICFILTGSTLLYIFLIKPQVEEKTLPEIVEFMRKYAEEKFGIKLYRFIDGQEGHPKGLPDFPMTFVVFTRNKFWNNQYKEFYQEPPPEQLVGFLVNRKNPKQIYQTFKRGKFTVSEMLEYIKKVYWGMKSIPHIAHGQPKWKREFEREAEEYFGYLETLKKEGRAWRGE